jgi:hypothetical protein
MSFGAVLGGALQGIGAGLAQQQRAKADTAAADVAHRREEYLLKLRGQIASDATVQQGQIARDNLAVKYDFEDRNDARTSERDTSKAIIVGNNTSANAVKLEQVKTANDRMIEGVKSRYRMTEQQQKAALDLSNDATRAGQEVGETRVAVDGSMVLYSKNGQVIRRSGAGMFTPNGAKATGTEGSTAIERARGGSPAAATPAPTAKPKPVPASANAGKAYTLAEAKATAAGRNITLEEVHKVMRSIDYKLTDG